MDCGVEVFTMETVVEFTVLTSSAAAGELEGCGDTGEHAAMKTTNTINNFICFMISLPLLVAKTVKPL